MDVDRYAVDRPLVGEHLHAVDQGDDAVCLLGDQPGQRAILVGDGAFEQLRGTAYPRQRVLDLVRQHRREASDGARRAAMRHLAVDLVGHRALLEHDDHRIRDLGDRRNVDVDDLVLANTRRGDVDAVFVVGRTPFADLLDEGEKRAAERHEAGERVAGQDGGARTEEVLGLGIGEGDAIVRAHHDDGMADRVEDDLRRVAERRCTRGRVHAAFLSLNWPASRSAAPIIAMTASGSVDVRAALRRSGPQSGAWRSRYQPRCLRACRTPLSRP